MLRGKTKIKQSKYKFYSIRSSTFRLANDESQTKQSNKYRNTLEKKETERKRGHRLTHTHTHTHACYTRRTETYYGRTLRAYRWQQRHTFLVSQWQQPRRPRFP